MHNVRKMWLNLILLLWFRMAFAESDEVKKSTETPPELDVAVEKFGTSLVTKLRNDVNLDLSQDEEYEDLRAELLAYHTALAKLSEASLRRSMVSTPCWKLGGVCIDRSMCSTARHVFQANACRDKRQVCCFTWNQAIVRENRELGLRAPYPWTGINQQPFQGKGLVSQEDDVEKSKKKKKKKKKKVETEEDKSKENSGADAVADAVADADTDVESNTETLALIIRSISNMH